MSKPAGKQSHYVSRTPDASGQVRYSDDENAIWTELYARQEKAIAGRACDEFLHGLDLLKLPKDRVPQLPEVSKHLRRETGWEVAYVPALIPFSEFFALLADRKFPAATFVRTREELDYLKEPDIFHEIFGHTPLLTNPAFAAFTHTYGKLGLAASKEDRVFLARMYWFTVEFGLVGCADALNGRLGADERPARDGRAGLSEPGNGAAGNSIAALPKNELKIYGGGILSSIGETEYAVGGKPQRRAFDIVEALRTPYRIDIMQPLYYVLESLDVLQEITRMDIMAKVAEAKRLGLQAPLFAPKDAASPDAGRKAA
ncbi:MAG: phenylalanine 4-monooxygenase [Nevskia sp.]